MLFSRNDVATFINDNFEPAWEMVREVPTVRIDFGGGRVLTRTLHGNIATYACTAGGDVLDILPGIYDPASYLLGLKQLHLLSRFAEQGGKDGRAGRLLAYHRAQAEALRLGSGPRLLAVAETPSLAKLAIERPVKVILQGDPAAALPSAAPAAPEAGVGTVAPPARELASWRALSEDARINETTRRLEIHEMLAERGLVEPREVTRPLYKDVLHADLDDPYLGLGGLLFAGYPFDDGPTPPPAQASRVTSTGG